MVTKGRGVLGLITVAMMFLCTLDRASAGDFVEITTEVRLKPKPPVSVTTGLSVSGKVNVHPKFSLH